MHVQDTCEQAQKFVEKWAGVSEAAKELNDRRERWLNPPERIDPIAERIDAADDFADVPADARPLIRQSAIMAAAAKDARLKKRTLTNLYNERPTWLKLAHETLDRAVLAAYAAVDPEGNWLQDWAAVWVDTQQGQSPRVQFRTSSRLWPNKLIAVDFASGVDTCRLLYFRELPARYPR